MTRQNLPFSPPCPWPISSGRGILAARYQGQTACRHPTSPKLSKPTQAASRLLKLLHMETVPERSQRPDGGFKPAPKFVRAGQGSPAGASPSPDARFQSRAGEQRRVGSMTPAHVEISDLTPRDMVVANW